VEQWVQTYTPVGDSLGLSALVAALPLLVLAVMLGLVRSAAWRAALAALAAALVVAVLSYGMPVRLAATSAVYGAAFGSFPIAWIVFAAILLFNITVEAGCLSTIERSLGSLSSDHRLQVLMVAFALGAFIEGTSGFGSPVAISASLLAALGVPAFTAAGLCLVANTAPVAFGSLAIPIVTLAGVTGLPQFPLGAAVGRLCPLIAVVIPMYLLVLLSGWRRALEAWPAALACGLVFAVMQFLVSNYIGAALTDIVAALAAAVALVILMRVWQPRNTFRVDHEPAARAAKPAATGPQMSPFRAWMPYMLLVVVVILWGLDWTAQLLGKTTLVFAVPGLHNVIERIPPVTATQSPYPAQYAFNWLASAGSATFTATIIAAALLGLGVGDFVRVFAQTARRLMLPALTIASVLALAYVMNYSGATATLGLLFARTGVLFPFFGTFLGWLGVFLTGSDTSANALFGNLQIISAQALGLNPVLMAAVNSTGGVLGKMISIQSIAVAAAATGMSRDQEGRLFMFTLRHSLLLTAALGLIALLFAYVFPQAIPSA
jgi:lactate permease